MKVQYLAAIAAASVLGLGTLTSCAPETTVDTEATEDVEAAPCAADPCAAEPCAADPCAAEPCAAE